MPDIFEKQETSENKEERERSQRKMKTRYTWYLIAVQLLSRVRLFAIPYNNLHFTLE